MLYALTYKYLVVRLSTRLLGTCVYAISLLLYCLRIRLSTRLLVVATAFTGSDFIRL